MKTADVHALKDALLAASDAIIEAEPELTRVDTVIGDGDHGIGMKRGFSSLKQSLRTKTYDCPYDLFHDCGICLVKSMGGSSGVLFGTLFIGGLPDIAGLQVLDGQSLRTFLRSGTLAVMKRGKAKAGDKTMVDALLAASEEMMRLPEVLPGTDAVMCAAAAGARTGAEKTKEMYPHLGRSKNFREQALGIPDPGALSVSILFSGMASVLKA